MARVGNPCYRVATFPSISPLWFIPRWLIRMALALHAPAPSSQNASRFCSAPFHLGRSLLRRLEGNGQGKSESGSGSYSQSIYKSQFIFRTAGGASASERDAGSTKGGRGKRSAVGADRQQ